MQDRRMKPGLVTRTVAADLETPVGVFLKLAHGKPNVFLLESVEGGSARGRYSVIGMEPDLIWRCREGRAEIATDALTKPNDFTPLDDPPLETLRRLLAGMQQKLPADVPPMAGGLVGYIGYDMVREMERLPRAAPDGLAMPDALLLRPSLFAIFDHVRDDLTLVAPYFPGAEHDDGSARALAERRVEAALAALCHPVPAVEKSAPAAPNIVPQSNMEASAFLAAVEKAKSYIAAGDAFQIVPSQRFSAPFALPPLSLYRALRRINPSPFLFHLDFGRFAVVGSSPEILVRFRDNKITIRPLAGTRSRGVTRQEDLAREAELLADPKERAEHLMLIDLARHDVGRVAEPASVRVTESFVIERFSHVMHISSTVEGIAQPGIDAVAALQAGFPAGTLTGAPKIRAMEIITELEPHARGLYAGCIGYFAPDGSLDTCIALRTAIVQDGMMYVQAGCGVVADSVPQAELEETRQKSRALFTAAEEAIRFANQVSRQAQESGARLG